MTDWQYGILLAVVVISAWLANRNINKKIKNMATKADLDAVIAALPEQIETAVDAAIAPVIQAIKDKLPAEIDFQPEIDALNAIGSTVAAKVAADNTPPV